MSEHMTPVMAAASGFALVGGISFVALAAVLSMRQHRIHPLLLLCISAISFSWIEAPYDWAMYAQFPRAAEIVAEEEPRLHGLYRNVVAAPRDHVALFVLPAFTATGLGRWLIARFEWRRPQTLLTVGLLVGFAWALFFNGFLGAKLGVFHYGRVIPGLAIREGTLHQYPLYDSLAMAIQMMVFTYLLGRTDAHGRNVVEMWVAKRSRTPRHAALLSVIGVVVVGNLLYGAVFAPHLITKLGGWVTAEPQGQLFPGVPNQPK